MTRSSAPPGIARHQLVAAIGLQEGKLARVEPVRADRVRGDIVHPGPCVEDRLGRRFQHRQIVARDRRKVRDHRLERQIAGHGDPQVLDLAEPLQLRQQSGRRADRAVAEPASRRLVDQEGDVGDSASAAAFKREAAGAHDRVAADVGRLRRHRAGQRDRDDPQLRQRLELAGVGHAVLVQVAPDSKL